MTKLVVTEMPEMTVLQGLEDSLKDFTTAS